ncbi:hypothetical protein SAMN04515665_10994 [Blastococcus sp. DSM 46786]|uniref:hypothetical protein n=1 Tax=Blastococcus sp. DSM 46786 TaxID=1798227 RepID=UPI0008AE08F5|nr:hypothetical protein [Blastococcus sp. DSM 46786]SEL19053.1 hypothetical protein SAMN04515665_10994 [Blastococcus sp. DSM 46786]
MAARSPARARFLGLWTAGWLALLLGLAVVRFGDPAVQWPVLLVPVLWALVALRPRRAARAGRGERRRVADDAWPDEERADQGWAEDRWADDDRWDDGWSTDDGRWEEEPHRWPPPGERTDTVERPAVRRRSDGSDGRW